MSFWPEVLRLSVLVAASFALGIALLWLMFDEVPPPPKGNQPHND